jgi:uncharacterized protein (DUF433 family)
MATLSRSAAGQGSRAVTGRDPSSRNARTIARPGPSRLGYDFDTFAATLRRAVVPASPLENVLTDRLILAAWRLQIASSVEFDSLASGETLPPVSRETLDVERSLEKSVTLLERSRADRLGRASDDERATEPAPTFDPQDDEDEDGGDLTDADFSNEWATLPDDRPFPEVADDDDDDDRDGFDDDSDIIPAPRWQDRLVFDYSVSETSPVVKGTWVTVGHVVSLIVDGWSWADVLRAHPELTEDDVRTCLAYSVDQDKSEF